MKRQARGITLIALVITIIILLILAGISISSLTGSGLFEKAKLAKNRTEETQELENQILSEYENQMESLGGSSSSGGNSGETGGGEIPVGPSFDEDTFTLGTNPSDAQNTDKYGWKVTEYTVKTLEMSTNVWRLFYQDSNYTYLITDECVGSYKPSDYYTTMKNGETLKYQTGADVSTVGQKLSPKISSLFTSNNTNTNIRTTAWLTDTLDTGMWSSYKNTDAVFAIGSGFTTETYSNINSEPYIIRGDCYENESGYTSYRSPSSSYDAPGFRPILYI